MTSHDRLQEFAVPLPHRIAALWTATMFCYVYGDLIGFYLPGRIEATAAGDLGPLGQVTPAILSAIAAILALPAAMIVLSLILPPALNRIANMAIASLYAAMIAVSALIAPPYYQLLSVIEIAFTLAIVHQCRKWPRT